jgi:CubicO group peptidase (beta-lactamase class C family)
LCQDYSDEQLVSIVASEPLEFQPGEKWNYSNTGYMLLGIIIKNITGKFWGDVAEERIFKPLSMKTARIVNEADIILNRAAGYRLLNNELKNQEYVSPSLNRTADGSLYLTILDLAKFDKALYSEKILKKSSLDQMWRPTKLNNGQTIDYGFGWEFEELNNHRVIFHGGAWQGFSGEIDRFIEDKLTVIVLTNLGPKTGAISYGIAQLYNPKFAPKESR